MISTSLLYLFAWKNQHFKKYSIALWSILLAGLLLRLFVAQDGYLHNWDERFHALVAKNMIAAPFKPMLYQNPVLTFDYQDWSSNHIWLHKQPLPLWLMAGSMSLFGVNEVALRLPSILLTTISIGIIYLLAKELFNRQVGLIAAFLCSINGLIIELAGGRVATDHIDVFFFFFILLGVYYSALQVQRQKWYDLILIGVAVGCGILVKWLPALIVFPVWFLLHWNQNPKISRKLFIQFGVAFAVATLVALPWQLYIHATFPQEATWEATFNTKHIFEGLDGHGQPFAYHFLKLGRIYGELVYLPLAWLTYKCFQKKDLKYGALFCWVIVPLLFFSLVKTKMQAYTLFSAPAIFISIGLFIEHLKKTFLPLKNQWYKQLSQFLILLLIALPTRYSIERIKPFTRIDRNPAWVQRLKEFNHQIANQEILKDQSIVVFNAQHPIATMFYLNKSTAYSFTPEQSKVDSLKKSGYLIYYEREGMFVK